MSFIVNNTGTNFTLYYNVLDYFKTIMSNHPSISDVSQGPIEDVDTMQYPRYPIGNVMINGATFGASTTDYSVQIIVADKIKNKNNESDGRTNEQVVPYYGVDDVVDIHANTLAIINDLLSFTQYSAQSFQIVNNIEVEPFADRFNNGLAGWSATFVLTTHNDRPRCLFDLYPTTSTTSTTTTSTTTTAAPTTTTTSTSTTTTEAPTTTTTSTSTSTTTAAPTTTTTTSTSTTTTEAPTTTTTSTSTTTAAPTTTTTSTSTTTAGPTTTTTTQALGNCYNFTFTAGGGGGTATYYLCGESTQTTTVLSGGQSIIVCCYENGKGLTGAGSTITQGAACNTTTTTTSTSTTTTTAAPALPSGAFAIYDFGNASSYSGTGTLVYDISGNARTGSLVNTPTFSSDNGGIMQFQQASSQYMTYDGYMTNDVTTIVLWKNTDATFQQYSGFPSDRTNYGLIWTNDIGGAPGNKQFVPVVANNVGSFSTAGSTYVGPADIQTFHQYSVTVKSNSATNTAINTYLDNGTTTASQTLSLDRTGTPSTTPHTIYVNRDTAAGGRYGNGYMMAYLHYNRVLTSVEIEQIYNYFAGRFTGTTTTTTTTAGPTTTSTTTTTTTQAPLSVDYLVVAGGGGGGWTNNTSVPSGGGGAGGFASGSASITAGAYSVVVGTGGAGATTSGGNSANGTNSSFNSITALGGGRGGINGTTPQLNGGNGGSGGGAVPGATAGTGTAGQGFDGSTGTPSPLRGGSGGGASSAATGTAGGNGKLWLNGSTYAAGGAGYGASAGTSGGLGNGGNGNLNANGTSGENGVVVIRYAGSQVASGGTVTSAGGYTYHTFNTSGTFTY